MPHLKKTFKLIEEFIVTFFQDIVWDGIIRFGAFIRWIFIRKKYSYKEVVQQDWNGRIGLLIIALIVVALILLI